MLKNRFFLRPEAKRCHLDEGYGRPTPATAGILVFQDAGCIHARNTHIQTYTGWSRRF